MVFPAIIPVNFQPIVFVSGMPYLTSGLAHFIVVVHLRLQMTPIRRGKIVIQVRQANLEQYQFRYTNE